MANRPSTVGGWELFSINWIRAVRFLQHSLGYSMVETFSLPWNFFIMFVWLFLIKIQRQRAGHISWLGRALMLRSNRVWSWSVETFHDSSSQHPKWSFELVANEKIVSVENFEVISGLKGVCRNDVTLSINEGWSFVSSCQWPKYRTSPPQKETLEWP